MNKQSILIAVSLALSSAGAAATDVSPVNFNWSIESGMGYETNVYHTPDHDYVDYYADPNGGVIAQPEEQAGVFIPLKAKTQLITPLNAHAALNARYRFSGYYYPESALNDASSTDHELNLGTDFALGEKGRKGKAYAGIFVRSHDKVYVDHDNGYPKTSTAGVDVSNRYTYKSFGLEGDYERKLSRRNSVGVKTVLESLDYEDPVAWNQYDHTYFMLETYLEHRLGRKTNLSAGISTELRDYSERHAYSADGRLLASNPLLTYKYMIYELGLRHRFSANTVSYFDYELLQRRDSHVGYNDMDQSSFKVRVIHDINDRMRLRVKVRFFDRDYLNAFNFEEPSQGIKSASGSDLLLSGEYRWNQHKKYYADFKQNTRDNSDDRYQYDNSSLIVGAKWEY